MPARLDGRENARVEATSEHRDATLVAVLVGILFGLTGMGSAAVAVALPPLAADLGLTTGGSAWVLSLYALALAVATALYGRISDLVGIRIPLLAGLALMVVGALAGAAAPSIEWLLPARLVQGGGAAAVATLGVSIINARFDGAVRARALGRVAGTAAAVTCLGPLAGGGLEAVLGWRSVIALPVLGLLFVPMLLRQIPVGGTGARLDLVGAGLVAASSAGLVLLIQSPAAGPGIALAGALLLVLGVPLTARWVQRRPDGFLPRAVVGNHTVVASALASSSIPAGWFALLTAAPAVLVAAGWAPWQVGLLLVPAAAAGLVVPRFAGPLVHRHGPTWALVVSAASTIGALVVAAVGLWLVSATLIAAAIVVVTWAFGLGQPALMSAVAGAVDADVRGVAVGVATLVFLAGGGIGSAVVGGIGELVGIPASLLLLALLPLAGIVVVRRWAAPDAAPQPATAD